jgi:hypothetical protein
VAQHLAAASRYGIPVLHTRGASPGTPMCIVHVGAAFKSCPRRRPLCLWMAVRRLGVRPPALRYASELLRDRHASRVLQRRCLGLNTWRRFHVLAFQHCSPPVPRFPITPMGIVHVGGELFRRNTRQRYGWLTEGQVEFRRVDFWQCTGRRFHGLAFQHCSPSWPTPQ